MVRGTDNPPRIVVELPNREPYYIWNPQDAIRFVNETLEAFQIFDKGSKK